MGSPLRSWVYENLRNFCAICVNYTCLDRLKICVLLAGCTNNFFSGEPLVPPSVSVATRLMLVQWLPIAPTVSRQHHVDSWPNRPKQLFPLKKQLFLFEKQLFPGCFLIFRMKVRLTRTQQHVNSRQQTSKPDSQMSDRKKRFDFQTEMSGFDMQYCTHSESNESFSARKRGREIKF
jgi:hypothetical protein